jgi:hypothetical protein
MDYMRECEAREWITRYRKKVREEGKGEAMDWWTRTLADIAKKRGQKAADQLRDNMNRQKNVYRQL